MASCIHLKQCILKEWRSYCCLGGGRWQMSQAVSLSSPAMVNVLGLQNA